MIVAYVCHVELAELLLLAVAGRPFVVVGHVFASVGWHVDCVLFARVV